jgi:hypothetical protein
LNGFVSLPPMLLPDGRLLAGRDSLYEPPRRRSLEENPPVDDEVSEGQGDLAKAQLGAVVRDSLTVTRANRLVEKLAGGKGARIPSTNVPIQNEDDLADVVALLLHAEASDARYPGSGTLKLLQRLAAELEFWHFGDSDEAGFDILRVLREMSGRNFQPLHMRRGQLKFEQELRGHPNRNHWPFYE